MRTHDRSRMQRREIQMQHPPREVRNQLLQPIIRQRNLHHPTQKIILNNKANPRVSKRFQAPIITRITGFEFS